jgi:hypothetical protein
MKNQKGSIRAIKKEQKETAKTIAKEAAKLQKALEKAEAKRLKEIEKVKIKAEAKAERERLKAQKADLEKEDLPEEIQPEELCTSISKAEEQQTTKSSTQSDIMFRQDSTKGAIASTPSQSTQMQETQHEECIILAEEMPTPHGTDLTLPFSIPMEN